MRITRGGRCGHPSLSAVFTPYGSYIMGQWKALLTNVAEDFCIEDMYAIWFDGRSQRFTRWLRLLMEVYTELFCSDSARMFVENTHPGITAFAGMDITFCEITGKTTVWWKNGQYVVLNFGDVAYNRNSNRYIVAMEDGCWLVG